MPVVRGAVIGDRHHAAPSLKAPPMGGDALTGVKYLDQCRRRADFDIGVDTLERDAVVATVVLDVIVNVDPSSLALGQLVAHGRQGPQSGLRVPSS